MLCTKTAALAASILLTAPTLADPSKAPSMRAVGRWILLPDGMPAPFEPGGRSRGLQPSGLVYRDGILLCLGDQRSEYPGHVFRIDPQTARLKEAPLRFRLGAPEGEAAREFEEYSTIPNADFEALCLDPSDPNTLIAVTEMKTPWIVEIRLEPPPAGPPERPRSEVLEPRIAHLERIRLPEGLAPWRDNTNFRFEGIAASDDEKTLYVAFERARDDLPRICKGSLSALRARKPVDLEVLRLPFESIPRRADKPAALLNLNDIQFLRWRGRPCLLALLRDQERLCLLDVERLEILHVVDVDFRDPEGGRMKWVSPEGLAIDAASDRVWIVNDPDSEGFNYKSRDGAEPEGLFASYAPLLFELKLSEILAEVQPPAGPEG